MINRLDANYPLIPSDVTRPSRPREVRKFFRAFLITKTKRRTRVLLDVYLSGEECSAHHINV